ncbi:MAG: hypothetical protein JW795_07410 [Chitinivibrionales bacterium]|nr:hypothetical protein [Chitinivibrionales bacterium]
MFFYTSLALISFCSALLLSCSSDLQTAGAAENGGKWQEAMEIYTAVVDKSVGDKFVYPDKTNPLWATEDDWIVQLKGYLRSCHEITLTV